MNIPAGLRAKVAQRAGHRCEYCRLSQKGQEATFHVDHIIPVAAGGETLPGNLALACVSCSLRKGARRSASDPLTGIETLLFHPRHEAWNVHFVWKGDRVLGITPTGRATVDSLKMNRLMAVAIRNEERFHGRHPP
jgi:hypothetical protein